MSCQYVQCLPGTAALIQNLLKLLKYHRELQYMILLLFNSSVVRQSHLNHQISFSAIIGLTVAITQTYCRFFNKPFKVLIRKCCKDTCWFMQGQYF